MSCTGYLFTLTYNTNYSATRISRTARAFVSQFSSILDAIWLLMNTFYVPYSILKALFINLLLWQVNWKVMYLESRSILCSWSWIQSIHSAKVSLRLPCILCTTLFSVYLIVALSWVAKNVYWPQLAILFDSVLSHDLYFTLHSSLQS